MACNVHNNEKDNNSEGDNRMMNNNTANNNMVNNNMAGNTMNYTTTDRKSNCFPKIRNLNKRNSPTNRDYRNCIRNRIQIRY